MISPPYAAEFFVLRTPLLPSETLSLWNQRALNRRAPGALINLQPRERSGWEEHCALLRAELQDQLSPVVSLALFLASPSLWKSIPQWRTDPLSKRGVQTERALTRYISRMSSRSTPFGIFATLSVGPVSGHLPSEPTASAHVTRQIEHLSTKTSFDYTFVQRFCSEVEQNASVQPQLRYRPNSTLYRFGDHWS